MILNLGSLAFNANLLSGGGTPAWGTELGQGEGYKFSFENMSDFFTGMVYASVPDIDEVTCPLGKGGNQQKDYDFVLASLFTKVFVNGKRITDASFLLLIVKKIRGEHHVGRRTIKYNPKITYRGEYINEVCFERIPETLDIPDNSAWFVHEINIKNQDELHFTVYVLGESPKTYSSIDERKRDFISRLPKAGTYDVSHSSFTQLGLNHSLQQIFYGAPGTGKSHKVNETTEQQPNENVFRITFHPDSDYSTFVGCYKPTMKPTGVILASKENEEVITYKFVAQTFTKAYIRAWQTNENVFLVIEEINRGNCAQIFGDLFQLLDRENGISEYPVDADTDLADFIRTELANSDRTDIPAEVKNGQKLMLPANLYIWATMNTSDQSLFPIDSAFKRRWEWKYLPINNHEDKNYKIVIGSIKYDWWGFLSKINEVIGNTTSSEDKKLGYFFAKANANGMVTAEQFVGKVLFYLWNDVFKNYGFDNQIFDKGDKKKFDFSDFFKQDGSPNTDMVNKFLGKLDETIDKENSFVEKPKDENGQGE